MTNEPKRIEYSKPIEVKHLDFPMVAPFNPKDKGKIETEGTPRLRAEIKLSLIEKIQLSFVVIWQTIKTFIRIKELNMSESTSKTTYSGIVKAIIAGLTAILLFFGIDLPADSANIIGGAILSIWALVELIQGYFSKDKEPTKE